MLLWTFRAALADLGAFSTDLSRHPRPICDDHSEGAPEREQAHVVREDAPPVEHRHGEAEQLLATELDLPQQGVVLERLVDVVLPEAERP